MQTQKNEMTYIREFEFFPEEGAVVAVPFGLEGATEGANLQDAVSMAADWLRIHVLDALSKGEEFPRGTVGNKPRRGGVVIAVAVEASLSDVTAMTAAQAARELGVSTARVAQLCSEGQLDSWSVGTTRMVSELSVLARKAKAGAHRPGRLEQETRNY